MVLFIYIFVVAFFCLSLIPCIIWRFSANGGLGGEILPAYNNNHNDNDNDNDIDNSGNRNDDDSNGTVAIIMAMVILVAVIKIIIIGIRKTKQNED